MHPDPTSQNPIEALLKDEAWLRRLARGLVGEAEADDLTQDVLVAAIKTPPRERGVPLRAWAKTVARRMAIRRGGRDRTRRLAEQGAARPEDADQQTEQRLLLHRRLTDSILSLEAPYRTVLVLRYLEELQPVEIAERLQITPVAARKRVSRGLAKLREHLDSEFEDRAQWMNALGPMAFGAGWQGMLPSAQAAAAGTPSATAVTTVGSATAFSLTPILALWTMKKLILTSVVLCLAIFAGYEILGSAQTDLEEPGKGENQAGLVPLAEPKPEPSPLLASSETTGVRNQASSIAPIPAASRLAQIILVDSNGAPAPGGKGAWLDENMIVHPLNFDDLGRADLPKAALNNLCLVRAEGLAIVDFEVESVEENRTVELPDLTTLTGQLLVDGGPPMDSVELECTSRYRPTTPPASPKRFHQDQAEILKELGLTKVVSSNRTQPDGSFEFDSVLPGSRGHVRFPDHLRLQSDERQTVALFDEKRGRLLIETTAYPHVKGRLLWAHDHSPFVGNVNVAFTNLSNITIEQRHVRTFETGRFTVSLQYSDSGKSGGLKHHGIRVRVSQGLSAKSQDFESLLNGDLLQQDMGDLLIHRVDLNRILVVDSEGRPIEDAHVASSNGRGRTDGDGFVELSISPGETLKALAAGYAQSTLNTGSEIPASNGDWVISMADGVGVRIACDLPGVDSAAGPSPFMRLFVARGNTGPDGYDPLEDAASWLSSVRPYPSGLSTVNRGILTNFYDLTDPIVLPGLLPGTAIEVDLVDALGGLLVHEEFEVRSEPGIMIVDLVPDPEAIGSLDLDVVDELGQSLFGAVIQGQSDHWPAPKVRSSGQPVLVSPLSLGSRRVSVSAMGRASTEVMIQVTKGTQEKKVVLLPGRTIKARIVDGNGVRLQYEWASLWSNGGKLIERQSGPASDELKFTGLPQESVELVAGVGTRTVRRTIRPDEVSVEVRLSATGKLRAHFEEFPALSGPVGNITMYIPEDGDTDFALLVRSNSFAEGATGSWDLDVNLEPGAYPVIVTFCSENGAPGKTATRTLFDGRVTIVAGEETLIVVSGGKNPTATLTPR